MSKQQWGHGYELGYKEGHQEGFNKALALEKESQLAHKFWILEQVADQLIKLSQRISVSKVDSLLEEDNNDLSNFIGMAEAVLLLSRIAYKEKNNGPVQMIDIQGS